MREVIFKIIIKQEIEIDLTIDEIRDYPTYNNCFFRFEEKMIVIEYNPVADFDKKGFETMMKNKVREQFNAYSIEIVNRELKEIDKSF